MAPNRDMHSSLWSTFRPPFWFSACVALADHGRQDMACPVSVRPLHVPRGFPGADDLHVICYLTFTTPGCRTDQVQYWTTS
jgi:hypothetical protein